MRIPVAPPSLDSLNQPELIGPILQFMANEAITPGDRRYWHWDDLRHRTPPQGLTPEQWWLAIKMRRGAQRQLLPLADKHERHFNFCVPAAVQRKLHWIDQQASGRVDMPEAVASEESRDAYLFNSLIEEAVRSSQLEGASTTRNVAKQMISEQRTPRSHDERMIFNNYRAMEHLREIRDEPLSPALINEIHRIVSEGTLDDDSMAGKYRRLADDIHIVDASQTKILFTPPPADSIASRIEQLCKFANAADRETDGFVHPLVKAVLLHFMIGFIHPYVDGNGRTARALFYWYAIKQGYWLMEFVSISRIIRQSPTKYGMAYLHTETDASDATYFLIHQLGVIQQAIESLHDYLQRKSVELSKVDNLLQQGDWPSKLNHRQLAVIQHGLRNPNANYNIEQHQKKHHVSYQTARTDLLALADKYALLEKQQKPGSKAFDFYVKSDLANTITNYHKS